MGTDISRNITIGLLALQGAYQAHAGMLEHLTITTLQVRYASDLDAVDAIIVPGGESTTMMLLLEKEGFGVKLAERVRAGMPYFGTCAGAIIAAREVLNPTQTSLGLADITVERNAYGRQVDSFTADIPLAGLGVDPFHAVFIRAPIITRTGAGAEILAEHGGHPILIRMGNILLATFHPELSGSTDVHSYFLGMVR